MPPSYLLLESAGRIELEDGSGFILLEGSVAPGTGASYDLAATHATQPIDQYGGMDIYNAEPTLVPAGETVTLISADYIFVGPALLFFNPAGASASFTMQLQAQQADGTWNTIIARDETDGARQIIPLFTPGAPLRLQVTNGTGSPERMDACLSYDIG